MILPPSLSLETRQRQLIGLVAISLGFFMVLLDTTILNVALPDIEAQLHGTLTGVQWISNSYTLVFASLLLSGGTLGDRFGVRRLFHLGLVIFAMASLLCDLSSSVGMLIAARALQGLGGAFMLPPTLALIAHLFPEPKEQARAVASWAGISSLAVASGPFLGGILVTFFGWHSIFLVNVPIGVVVLLLGLMSLPVTEPQRGRSLDFPGQVLIIIACCSLSFGLIELGHMPTLVLVVSFLLAAVTGVSFVFVELRTVQPMMQMSLFRSWRITSTMLVALLIVFTFYGSIFLFSLYFQQVYHWDALQTGLAILPQTAPCALMSFFVIPRVMHRLDSQKSLTIGNLIGIVASIVLIVGIHTNFLMLALGELLIGIGAPFVIVPMSAVVLASVEKQFTGMVSATLNTFRQMGGALGVAILGVALGSQPTTSAMQVAIEILLVAFVLGFVLSASALRKS
jgi:MFS transporter, DHA2 family, methylenomycin A resistance protein